MADTTNPTDWIAHAGGPCPVPADTLVDVRFRDGVIAYGFLASFWHCEDDWWRHEGGSGEDIVAYRLAQPAQPEPKLKPCPFCGRAPKLLMLLERPDNFVSETIIRCDECGISVADEYHTNAIAGWESRSRLSVLSPASVDTLTPEEAWRNHLEKDDRNSPEEYPEMALITFDELADYMQRAALSPARPAASEGQALMEAARQAQRVLAILIDPGCQGATSALTIFAQATEAECKLRAALSAASRQGGEG